MEKYLTNNIQKSIKDIIKYIKSQEEYKNIIKIRQLMKDDTKLLDEIKNVKNKQKEYIRSGKDIKIKEELQFLTNKLEKNLLYFEYKNNLDKVNEMIAIITDELNNYFIELTNILK